MAWETIKEIFFAIGALAGLIALSRPLFNDKFSRDQEKASALLQRVPEEEITALETYVWANRCVPDWIFNRLAEIRYDLDKNHECVRFSGPIAKFYIQNLKELIEAYASLRELVQVNEWEPVHREDERVWLFNKKAFENSRGIPEGYDDHLYACGERASAVAKAYQRLQITLDLHLFEFPLAGILLHRRYAKNSVSNCQVDS